MIVVAETLTDSTTKAMHTIEGGGRPTKQQKRKKAAGRESKIPASSKKEDLSRRTTRARGETRRRNKETVLSLYTLCKVVESVSLQIRNVERKRKLSVLVWTGEVTYSSPFRVLLACPRATRHSKTWWGGETREYL